MPIDDESVDPGLLRERVYGKLKDLLNAGRLKPGAFLDLTAIGRELGLSRTPLRDALIRLEIEGFVRIYPRRGVMVRSLDLQTIKNVYELIGALESAVIAGLKGKYGPEDSARMAALNAEAGEALARDDFSAYYAANLEFHRVYLGLSDNAELVRSVNILKERLYDFPRRTGFVKEWEVASVREHGELIGRLDRGDFAGAAAFVREVHWSYESQERFIKRYYSDGPGSRAPGGGED
ncbi:MAG TPA: GntR family transcriptional regulator [Spirochaetia bacterium]|nr:GntR family transcriptional regulator [Spirochaetales bacterium]HRY73562.1 GntR family transcriptional regulator [Spirochaetia bacterium]